MAAPIGHFAGKCLGINLTVFKGSRHYLLCVPVCRRKYQTSSLRLDQHGSLTERFKKASSETQPIGGHVRPICRTSENNPANHTLWHEGLFYMVPDEDHKRWLYKGMRPQHYRMIKAFNENFMMVRRPALEIMGYMKEADYNLPAIRYLLYGREGTGKTMSLSHILHYCGLQGWMILHVPWGPMFSRYVMEVQPSSYKVGRMDTPITAAEWLSYFMRMNEPVIRKHELRIENSYVWSKREKAEPGTPWREVIEFGLGRVKYASDVVGLIVKEVKHQASQRKLQVLVAVDGVNAFWDSTGIKREEDRTKKYLAADLTICHNFKKILRNDWNSGAILCTVDDNAGPEDRRDSCLPHYLLGKEGSELFDPHIPVHVPDYTDKEMYSSLEYYMDRQWIQNPKGWTEEGRKEIRFLSCNNPHQLYRVTANW